MNNLDSISHEISRIEEDGRLRRLRTLPEAGGKISMDGRSVLNFSSNDYLNLASNPALKRGACEAIERYGCGATASRLMAGHLDLHERLEERLAGLVGKESALVFPTGFQANVGVLSSLASHRHDLIFSDELNHASIVDGCKLARGEAVVYRHCDVGHLDHLLKNTPQVRRRVIVTDSVFSMDGDHAPLEALAELAQRHDALLVVDEAHAVGMFGGGGGLCKELGVNADVVVGTLSKALGGEGGFAAGAGPVRELLINRARSFIFSTGLAPACAGSALAAVDLVEQNPDWGPDVLDRAESLRAELRREGFSMPADPSPIIPLVVGDNRAAVALSELLLDQGILVAAVRPPSVPARTARLRFSVTRAHDEADLERVAATTIQCLERESVSAP